MGRTIVVCCRVDDSATKCARLVAVAMVVKNIFQVYAAPATRITRSRAVLPIAPFIVIYPTLHIHTRRYVSLCIQPYTKCNYWRLLQLWPVLIWCWAGTSVNSPWKHPALPTNNLFLGSKQHPGERYYYLWGLNHGLRTLRCNLKTAGLWGIDPGNWIGRIIIMIPNTPSRQGLVCKQAIW